MKVVINTCRGGFGLSHKAIMRYAELKGIKLYPWLDNDTVEIWGKEILNKSWEEIEKEGCCIHYTTVPKEEYEKLKEEEKETVYFSEWKIERTDPILIQVVEELGKEANDRCSKLKIVEIPDEVDFYIDEHNGKEWIAEKHRTWE